jgi:hypothetical protein
VCLEEPPGRERGWSVQNQNVGFERK